MRDTTPIYSLWERLTLASLVVTIPCAHGWEQAHCDRDDEGSHVSDSATRPELRGVLLPTDSCYCGQAIRVWLLPVHHVRAAIYELVRQR